MNTREVIYELLSQLLVALMTVLVAHPLLSTTGLPSYSAGRFRDATIAYYIEWARELDAYGPYTPAWCGGFDLLRFYPPLGLTLIYLIGRAAGDFPYAAQTSFFLAIYVFALGAWALGRSLTGSRLAGLATALTALSITGYVSTISVYWEYTRILGEGLAMLALSELNEFMRHGEKKSALLFGVFTGLTVLTHLIASLLLATLSAVTAAYWVMRHMKKGAGVSALTYIARLLAVAVALALAISGWWLIPALIPFGISHYMRVQPQPGLVAGVFTNSVSLFPPLYEPGIQAPLLLLGFTGIALQVFKGRERLPLLYVSSTALLVLLYGQGFRLIPTLGLFMVASLASTYNGRLRELSSSLALTAVVAASLIYFSHYIPVYWSNLSLDHTYVESDEYLIAEYLAGKVPSGHRVYAMYGPLLHGNQWINVFEPGLWQVLSGFMEGCVKPEPLELDYLVKDTLHTSAIREMIVELNVDYIAVDKEWYETRDPNSIKLLEAEGFLVKDPVSKALSYTLLFKVNTTGGLEKPVAEEQPSIIEYLLLPSRLAGYSTSLLMLYVFTRMKKET